MIRLAHFGDVHLHCPRAHWQLRDWFNKRLTGWGNLHLLGRGGKFRHARTVLHALADDVFRRCPDCVLFTGDATALGFEEEFAEVARLLRIGKTGGLPGLAVPGNHDYYTRRAAKSGLFEKYFGPWLDGRRLEGATYPFARRLGPLWLIAVNSSTGNRWFWDATGRVGDEQLDRLRRLLNGLDREAPRILVTHYPIARCGGVPERRNHLLRDLSRLLQVAQAGGVSLWLHGHRHDPYYLPASPMCPIPSLCCGSGTQEGIWTYAEYTCEGETFTVERRRYQTQSQRFEAGERFTVPIAPLQPVQ